MKNQSKPVSEYRSQHPILDVMGKILLNIMIAALLLGFGFWLLLASNMGSAYLPYIRDGALDGYIRFTLLGIGAIIWVVTPIWFLWSTGRYSYNSYRIYKRRNLADRSI